MDENIVDPNQLASKEASQSRSALFSKEVIHSYERHAHIVHIIRSNMERFFLSTQ